MIVLCSAKSGGESFEMRVLHGYTGSISGCACAMVLSFIPVRCYCTVREDMCLSPNCEMLVYHGPDGEQHEQRKRQVTKVTTVQEHDCVDARHF